MAHILHFNIKKGTIKMISRLLSCILVYFLWITSSTAQFFDEGHTVRDVKNRINWLRCTVGKLGITKRKNATVKLLSLTILK